MGYEPWLRKSHQKSNLFLIRRRIVIVAAAPCRRPRRLRFVAVTDNPWRDGMKGGWCRVNLETIHLFGPERSRRLGIINYKKICNFPQNKFGEQSFLHSASGRSWQRSIIRRIVLFVEKGPSGICTATPQWRWNANSVVGKGMTAGTNSDRGGGEGGEISLSICSFLSVRRMFTHILLPSTRVVQPATRLDNNLLSEFQARPEIDW